MKKYYLTDIQSESIHTLFRLLVILSCGVLFYFNSFDETHLQQQASFYFLLAGVSYSLIIQLLAILFRNKEYSLKIIINFGIICDFIFFFGVIELSGSISSPLIPIIYLALIHVGFYWKNKGMVFAVFLAIVGYTGVSFVPQNQLLFNEIMIYAINVVAFIFIGLFVRVVTKRHKLQIQNKVSFQDLSVRDYISGLYNHRSFQTTLSKLTTLQKKSFALVLADIDDLKVINERYNYSTGDQVIQAFGNTLLHQLDLKENFCFRYGGEEFAIVLFDRQKKSIERQIHQWNELFQHGISLIPDLSNQKITLSYGVAFYEKEDSKEQLLARAQENLYLAKSHGKDQIIFQESYERVGE